jgi:hypothetical protein
MPRNQGGHLQTRRRIGEEITVVVIPPAVGIGSFNRDPTGSESPTRSPLGRGETTIDAGGEGGRESFSGNDEPHGKPFVRKRLPTPVRLAVGRSRLRLAVKRFRTQSPCLPPIWLQPARVGPLVARPTRGDPSPQRLRRCGSHLVADFLRFGFGGIADARVQHFLHGVGHGLGIAGH